MPVRACDPESNPVWLFASIGEYPVYDEAAYEAMINDGRRMSRYAEAVRRYAPGRTVLDIGTLGGSEGAGSVLRDARERLVKPGGVFIPHRSATTAVALDLDSATLGKPPGFPPVTFPYVEEVFASVGRAFDLRVVIEGLQDNPKVRERSYLSGPVEMEPLKFNGELQPEGADAAELAITRPGRFSGLALGVRLWVAEDDEPIDSLVQPSNWTPVYAPLSEEGPPVRPGDRFEFDFTTTLSDDGVHPDYALTGELHRAGAPAVPLSWTSTHHGEGFRTTPFYRSLFPGPGGP